jgi:hypothetical protein
VQNSNDIALFHEDLARQVNRLALKHNLIVPSFNVVPFKDAYHIQFIAHKEDPEGHFYSEYLEHKDALGLKEEWLNKTFQNVVTKRFLTLKGLDLSLGENCLRLIDTDGVEYSMAPSSFILMIEQLGY